MFLQAWMRDLTCIGWILSVAIFSQVVENHETEVVTVKAKGEIVNDRLDLSEVARLIIRQTNDFRQSEKRSIVKVAPKLTDTVQEFAAYMARTNRYGHSADGEHPDDRAKKHGYDYCIISENIAYEYSSVGFKQDELAKGLTEGWKHSPGHRKNMLDPDVTETAVAVAWSSETGHYYAVQMFGRPKSMMIEFKITNESEVAVQYQIGDRKLPLPPGLIRTHQVCRPVEVKFIWSDSANDVQVVKPETGNQLVITRENDKFQLKRE
ncbi:MAG: hypothetical protein JWM11_7908 [Planctomycetaceae bacterium]|nr:hypothetical protein [Planctomycetaceae bacterium]